LYVTECHTDVKSSSRLYASSTLTHLH